MSTGSETAGGGHAPPSFDYIDTPAALAQLCARLAGCEWIALDTEFVRERTYYPRLGLLQLATAELNACVDPLALPDLEPLFAILFDRAVLKVMHACQQDLEIFYHRCKRLPAPIFDTQIAAPLLGLPQQASYAALVKEVLGVTLAKAHTRADWTARPLAREQLLYAVEDVHHLGPLFVQLRDELARRGRLGWLDEDFAALSDPARYCVAPEDAWERIRGAQRLNARQQAALRSLAAWRETAARQRDLPRGWLLRDEALVDVARARPSNPAQLARIRTLPKQAIEQHGGELLAALRAAETGARPERVRPPAAPPPDARQEALADVMMALVRVRCAELAINPAIVAMRGELIALAQGERELEILRGWRRNVAGQALIDLLGGRTTLTVEHGAMRLTGPD